MTRSPRERFALFTPTGRDTEVAASLLNDAGVTAIPCRSLPDVSTAIHDGVDALVIAEEAFINVDATPLMRILDDQEPWSDLPIIMLALPGGRTPGVSQLRAQDVFGASRNVTVIERPFRALTLVSAVGVAVRSRRRQHQMRHLLADIRRGEEQLRLAVRTGRLGVWRLDLATRELEASDICKANYGRPLGVPFTYDELWGSIHVEDRARVHQEVQAALAGEADYETEYRAVWPDGSLRWMLVRGQVTRDTTGQPLSMAGVSLDITERRIAEERREQTLSAERAARAEAERLGRMKDEFLATLSHELRTPLNAILGWAQMLNRGTVRPEQRAGALQTIERNAKIQSEMIEDLLDMSRVISGKLKLQAEPTDLAMTVRAAADTVAMAAAAKGVSLDVHTDSTIGTILADGNRLQQVIWNLLNNAVKFTEAGGVVRTTLRRDSGHAIICVTDTGRGIDADFLPYVFERFRQADGSITRAFGGLGLGLAIVKQLVELHGGSVAVESAGLGRGSTFTVTLPIRVPTEADVLAYGVGALDHRDRRDAAAQFEMDVRLDNLRVLLVDDDDDGRELVYRLLGDRGAHVVQANSAAAALANLQAEAFDVLVSDIGMPLQDGYGLIAAIRHLPAEAGGRIPAIALTAFARDADRVRALDAGFDAHVPKPIEPDYLISLVKSLATHGATPPVGHSAAIHAGHSSADENFSQPAAVPSGGTGRALNVLVVDDTKVIGEVLEQIFASLGHRATVAQSGQAALDLIGHPSSPAFDIIFSDISMPGMNGHELATHLRELRQQGTLPAKLLVAMSGYSEPEERARSAKSGFDRHLVKPPELGDLEDLLAEVQRS